MSKFVSGLIASLKVMGMKSRLSWIGKNTILYSAAVLIIAVIFFRGRLPTLEEISELVKISAIVVGGLWTYYLFVRNRKDFPYTTIRHEVQHWLITDDKLYLSVGVTITNGSSVLIPLIEAKIFVRQIRPLDRNLEHLIKQATEEELREGNLEGLFQDLGMIEWPELGYRETRWEEGHIEIEPGENEKLQYDFIIDKRVQSVKIISYFKNQKRKTEGGWVFVSFYDIEEAIMTDKHGKTTESERITESQTPPERTIPAQTQTNDLSQPPPTRTTASIAHTFVNQEERASSDEPPPIKSRPSPRRTPPAGPSQSPPVRTQPPPKRTDPPSTPKKQDNSD